MIEAHDLSGKTALITGASSGLGAHFAELLSAAGMTVVLAARRRAVLDRMAADLAAKGRSASAVELDVANARSIARAVAEVGPIDVLVNNAGVTVSKPLLDQTEADYDHVVDIDLKGTFLVATAVARTMRDAKRSGSIINIASILGLRQAGHVSTYAIAKAGVIQMTKSMALELARYGIRVNALAPGYLNTDLNADFLATDAGQALAKRIPQRRFGDLHDLDGPLLLLASDASRYMTGSVIAVDGGHLCNTL